MNKGNGWVIWLTGLPASGKTTVAQAMQMQLSSQDIDTVMLDSDELRRVLTPNASYTPEERDLFYSQVVGLAELLSRQGFNVIIAATGNRRRYRDEARRRLPRFAEVWVQCPLELCQARDPKGLYAQATSPETSNLPGIGASYEAPLSADVIVDTGQQTPDESAHQIIMTCGLLHDNRAVSSNQ